MQTMQRTAVATFVLLCTFRLSLSCGNPMGTQSYNLGEGPSAHATRLASSPRWQDKNAVDFRAPAGTPVYALTDGVVCDPAKDSQCVVGKTAEELKDKHSLNSFYLNASDGKQYYYTHLQSVAVKGGQAVKKGDVLGAVGAYNGQNAHLHLAVNSGNVCEVLTKCQPSDARSCK